MMAKKLVAFRLSQEARAIIDEITAKTGFTKTQVVEQSLFLCKDAHQKEGGFVQKLIADTKAVAIRPRKCITGGSK